MPATRSSFERQLARDVDEYAERGDAETCPECNGRGYILWHQSYDCPRCDGTGLLPVADDDGDRAYDRWVDRQAERAS